MVGNIWHFVVFAGEPESAISTMSPVLPANICQVELFCLSAITMGWQALFCQFSVKTWESGRTQYFFSQQGSPWVNSWIVWSMNALEHAGPPQERSTVTEGWINFYYYNTHMLNFPKGSTVRSKAQTEQHITHHTANAQRCSINVFLQENNMANRQRCYVLASCVLSVCSKRRNVPSVPTKSNVLLVCFCCLKRWCLIWSVLGSNCCMAEYWFRVFVFRYSYYDWRGWPALFNTELHTKNPNPEK